MKNKMKAVRKSSQLVTTVLAGVMLMAPIGCVNVRVELPEQQVGHSGTPNNSGTAISQNPRQETPFRPLPGANFQPVQVLLSAYTAGTTMCTPAVTITDQHARFYPPNQSPTSPQNAFRGYVVNTATGARIATSTYVLQWFVTIADKGCAVPVGANEVTFPATPGKSYKLSAHFLPGPIPPSQVRIEGAWIIN